MNKKRNFAKLALLGALLCGLASPTFVGCKDYDDDIKDLQEQITSNKKEIDDILQKIKDGQYVQKVETVAEGIKITLGSGDVVTIKNGTNGTNGTNGIDGVSPVLHIEAIDGVDWFVDQNGVKVGKVPVPTPGEPGQPGEPGTPGVSGKSPYSIGEADVNGLTAIGNWAVYDDETKAWKDSGVKALNVVDIHSAYVVEETDAFILNVWNNETEAYESFYLPKSVDYIQSLVFNPTYSVGGLANFVPVFRLFDDKTTPGEKVGLLTSNMNIDFILTPLAARPNISEENLSFILKETVSLGRATAPELIVNENGMKNLDNGFSLNVSLKGMSDELYSSWRKGWTAFLQVQNDKVGIDYTTTAISIYNAGIYTSDLELHNAEGDESRELAYNSDEIVDLNSEIKLCDGYELLENMNFDLSGVTYTVTYTYENYAGVTIATADAAGFVVEDKDNTVKMKEAKTNYIGNKCIANVVAKLGEVELVSGTYTITVTAEPIVVKYANDEIFGQNGATKEWANENVNFYFGSATASSEDFQKKLYTAAGCATLDEFLALVDDEFATNLAAQANGVKFVWYGANESVQYKGLRIVAPLTAEWKTYDLTIDIPLQNGTVIKFSTTIDLTMPDLSGLLVKRPAFWEGNQMLIVGSKDGANPYLMEGNLLDAYNSYILPDGVTLSFKKVTEAATVTLNATKLTWNGEEFDGTNNIVSMIPVLTYGVGGIEKELTSFDAKFVNPVKALTWTFAAKTLTDNAAAVQSLALTEGLVMKDRFGDDLIEATGAIKGDYATIYGLEAIQFAIVKVEVDGVEVENETKLSITNDNKLEWNNVGGAAIVKPMTVTLKASMVNAWGVQESQVVTVTVKVNSGN